MVPETICTALQTFSSTIMCTCESGDGDMKTTQNYLSFCPSCSGIGEQLGDYARDCIKYRINHLKRVNRLTKDNLAKELNINRQQLYRWLIVLGIEVDSQQH